MMLCVSYGGRDGSIEVDTVFKYANHSGPQAELLIGKKWRKRKKSGTAALPQTYSYNLVLLKRLGKWRSVCVPWDSRQLGFVILEGKSSF
jgi:hypothetical protein